MKYFIRPWLYLNKCGMQWEDYRYPSHYTRPWFYYPVIFKKKAENQNTKYYKRWELNYEQLSGSLSPETGWTWHNLSITMQGSDSYLCVHLQSPYASARDQRADGFYISYLLDPSNLLCSKSLKLQPRDTMAVLNWFSTSVWCVQCIQKGFHHCMLTSHCAWL